jgi:diadenosine tetraphosphate (Ap4A) HIT family hydrolase
MLIKDLTGKEIEVKGCLGCEISNGNLVPFGGILYRDNYFLVNTDFELPIDGFIIISAVRHVEKYTDLSEKELNDLTKLIYRTLNILRENNVCDEYNIILEEKKDYHFHIWLMPRHKWMIQKFGKVLKNIKAIQDYSVENMKTKENLKKISKTCKILKKELNKK